MPTTPVRPDERGQVGIGTLIVFIAMILVAAITATVLLNVVGDLEEQAEATGEQSTGAVSTGVRVTSVVGTVDGGGSGIDTLSVTLKLRPGSDDVDLSRAVIRYVDPETTRHLTHSGSPPKDLQGDEFNVSGVRDAGDSSTYVMNHPQDVYAVQLNLTEVRGSPLPAGESATLQVTPPSGTQTERIVRIPPVLDPAGESMNLR